MNIIGFEIRKGNSQKLNLLAVHYNGSSLHTYSLLHSNSVESIYLNEYTRISSILAYLKDTDMEEWGITSGEYSLKVEFKDAEITIQRIKKDSKLSHPFRGKHPLRGRPEEIIPSFRDVLQQDKMKHLQEYTNFEIKAGNGIILTIDKHDIPFQNIRGLRNSFKNGTAIRNILNHITMGDLLDWKVLDNTHLLRIEINNGDFRLKRINLDTNYPYPIIEGNLGKISIREMRDCLKPIEHLKESLKTEEAKKAEIWQRKILKSLGFSEDFIGGTPVPTITGRIRKNKLPPQSENDYARLEGGMFREKQSEGRITRKELKTASFMALYGSEEKMDRGMTRSIVHYDSEKKIPFAELGSLKELMKAEKISKIQILSTDDGKPIGFSEIEKSPSLQADTMLMSFPDKGNIPDGTTISVNMDIATLRKIKKLME